MMAILAKKIHIKNSAGTEQTVNLYSTTGEVANASGYTFQLVDGVTAYAPLVATNHATATSGRVLKGGTTYAWGSTAPGVAYNYRLITTAGGGTFTVPAGVNKLRVTCVGGGAGGVVADFHRNDGYTSQSHEGEIDKSDANRQIPNANSADNQRWAEVTRGGTTTFGSVSAAGATPAVWNVTYIEDSWQEDGMVTWYYYYKRNSFILSAGTTNGSGATNTSSFFSGAPAVALTAYNGAQRGTAGAGGVADGTRNDVSSGGSGRKTVSTITVTPGSTISYNVGNFGYGMKFGTKMSSVDNSQNGINAGRGYPGAILVEWGEGIQ